MKNLKYTLLAVMAAVTLASCEKVSPIGVLVSGTAVEDRVKMSNLYFREHKMDITAFDVMETQEYSFIVGADSHMTTDTMRMAEMLDIGIRDGDLFFAHLGDIADTKPEYYINLENTINDARMKFADKYYEKNIYTDEYGFEYWYYYDKKLGAFYDTPGEIPLPFFPVVGNHDITHNGWALWSNIFHSSFYDFYVIVGEIGDELIYDHYIFLDTASGTLGEEQVRLIEEGVMNDRNAYQYGLRTRHTCVFSHTNIFRPSSLQFASTFAREESYFLINKFIEWDTSIVFCGHVHKWDDQTVGGVRYITLDSMSERNSPDAGDYLVRVKMRKSGDIEVEKVRMNYVAK